MASCVFLPEEIMLNIQTRLPVTSIGLFKSVCKPWLHLFSSPRFMKLHHSQFSSDPKNQSVIFYEKYTNNMSILNIETSEKKSTIIIDGPYFETHWRYFVGCYNGLICIELSSIGPNHVIVLWNPATKLFKSIPPKRELKWLHIISTSLGFGYDKGCDFKVVRIVHLEYEDYSFYAEVYSANSDSWTTIDAAFEFKAREMKNDVIVNGNPFWVATVDGNEVLVCCDVTKLEFKIVPMPAFYKAERVKLVDCNDDLGALVSCANDTEMSAFLDVWVFEESDRVWRKNCTLGPYNVVSVDRFLLCLKNGYVIGEHPDGNLFVFDHNKASVEEIVIDKLEIEGAPNPFFEVYGYTKSLAHIRGMKQSVEVE